MMDWLSPPGCAACDRALTPAEHLFCEPCEVSVEPLVGPRCPKCGQVGATTCQMCRSTPPPFRAALSLYAYGGAIAQALRRFKYGKRLDLARPLAELVAPALMHPSALVVPIPSSHRALRHRGFDPVREILRACPWLKGRWAPLLCRVDDREPQAGRQARERRSLGPEAFRLKGRLVHKDRPILLFDDVFTTGATVRAAAAVIRASGGKNIRVVTLVKSEERRS